jgi:pimeloyl-ACP methyl ester carboxylesterase
MRVASFPVALLLAACQTASAPARGVVRSADGIDIAYESRGGGGIPLVFIHGWCCNRGFWREQVETFAGEHRVITVDLPGHGESAAQRPQWSVAAFAGDVQALADSLGLRRMILIGHSMGAPVALEAARRMPGRVVGVVGVDSLHDAEFEWPAAMIDATAQRFEEDFDGTMAAAVGTMTADEELARWIVEQATATDRAAALGLLRDFRNVHFASMMAGAGVPIRCINAAGGSGRQETKTATNRKHADFDAEIMEGVGHFPMLERPREFNEHLRRALRAIGGRRDLRAEHDAARADAHGREVHREPRNTP